MSTPVPPAADDPGAAEPPDDEVLAGEFVLGVLSPQQRRAAQAREESDPRFAARIAGWERRFAPWLAEIEPVTTPAELWLQVCRRLGWRPTQEPRAGLWQSLALWRTAAAVAALAAVTLWLARAPAPVSQPPVAVVLPTGPEPAAKPVTTLAQGDGRPGWLASVDLAHGTVLMVPVPRAPDAQGRVPELWIIPSGKPPRSLGIVSLTKSHTVAVPADSRAALAEGSVLAITLEPAAGAPHGAPTGPIIAKGAIQT